MSQPVEISRRGLLAGATAAASLAAGASSLIPRRARAQPLPAPTAPAVAVDPWESLRRLTGGRLVRPGEDAYSATARPNNLRYGGVRPQGIASCVSPEVVAEVLSWCRDHGMPFAIRGGGHSYAGHSTSHGLVIDVSPMRAIAYDPGNGRVRVEAGALNADVYAALRAHGRMITHGRCPTVGVAGFLLGGGIGFNMRRLGIASDLLTEAEIVTAEGRHRAVSHLREPDLFWALRGGAGGNFGVSTSFTLQTRPADERLQVFRIVWFQKSEEVAAALLSALDAAPVALGCRISLGAITPEQRAIGRDVPVNLLGQFAGPREELLAILRPALEVGRPDMMRIEEHGYWDGQAFLADPGEPIHLQERSAFLPGPVSAPMLAEGLGWLRRWPGTGGYCDLRFFQTGGQINAVAADASAFVHRDSHWLMVIGLTWSGADQARPATVRAAHAWQDDFYQAMRAFGSGGAFQNFPDPSLVDWRDMYYGANLARLKAVKAKVDPTNLFRHPQSI